MSSLSLAHEANALLDEIEEKGADEFTLTRLEEMRGNMLAAGFSAPLGHIIAATKSEVEDYSPAETEDVRKQIGNIRYLAAMKKFTLNRVRVAIAANKIAAALSRLELAEGVKYLPLGGSYRKRLFGAHPVAIDCYHKLMEYFSAHAFDIEVGTAKVQLESAGMAAQIDIDISDGADATEKVLDMFGPEASVVGEGKRKKRVGLIRNYSAKVALFCAASLIGAQEAERQMKGKKEDEDVAKYNAILARHKMYSDVALSDVEGFEGAKKEAKKAGFLTQDIDEFEFAEGFAEKIAARRRQRKKFAERAAQDFVLAAMMRTFVMFNENGRGQLGIPSLMATPDEKQLSVLAHLAPEGYAIKHPSKFVAEKIAFEKSAPPLPSSSWGPAFICAKTHIGIDESAKLFGADDKEISAALPIVSSLIENPQGRGAKFLEGARKGKKE